MESHLHKQNFNKNLLMGSHLYQEHFNENESNATIYRVNPKLKSETN